MPTTDATSHLPLFAAITIAGSGRLGPTACGLAALVATVVGARALVQARRQESVAAETGRPERTAMAVGGGAALLGAMFLAAADSGPGSGNGVVASAVALVLGPVAVLLGGLARTRRREADPAPELAKGSLRR